MGDLKAKIGEDNNDWRGTMGTEGLWQMNEDWLLFASFCALNYLVIGGKLGQVDLNPTGGSPRLMN